jgi:hypothetical protein
LWSYSFDTRVKDCESLELPCSFICTDEYLYIIFGACEVYLCRILLPCNGAPEFSPEIKTTKEPAFLPASTATEREFTFIPNKKYAVFTISSSRVSGCFDVEGY